MVAMTDWLDDDEMQAWRGLVEVFSDVRASLEAELTEQFGLTEGDYGVLVVLSEASDQRPADVRLGQPVAPHTGRADPAPRRARRKGLRHP